MPTRPVLPFATPWVIEDDLLLFDDGSSLDACDQPCVQSAGFGVGWCEKLCRPFQLMEENNARGVYVFTLALRQT